MPSSSSKKHWAANCWLCPQNAWLFIKEWLTTRLTLQDRLITTSLMSSDWLTTTLISTSLRPITTGMMLPVALWTISRMYTLIGEIWKEFSAGKPLLPTSMESQETSYWWEFWPQPQPEELPTSTQLTLSRRSDLGWQQTITLWEASWCGTVTGIVWTATPFPTPAQNDSLSWNS